MKTSLLIIVFLLLAGCGNPQPMSDAEAMAYMACLDDGLNVHFFANANGSREMTCIKK